MTKPNSDPILHSDKLTSLRQDLAKQKSKAENSRANVWRMTQIVSPHVNNVTVRTVINEKDEAAKKIAVVPIGIDEQDDAARRDDELRRTLAGEPLAESIGIQEKLAKEHRQWAAYEDAIEFITREIEQERTLLAIAYAKTLKPKHDQLMKNLGNPMLAVHAALLDIYEIKRHLIDNGVGLRGLCLTLPDFLSTPNNPYSELADWFRAMKREGYISSIPNELSL
jgi:hypothetical protein